MPLIYSLLTLLFVGQWVVTVLGQDCPGWSGMNTCQLAEQIRRSSSCAAGGPTGYQRPLNDGPTSEYQNRCICSSVYYSLVMACQTCTRGYIPPFRQWHQNCRSSNVLNGDIQLSGFQLPSWAFLRYEGQNPSFNEARARAAAAPAPTPTPPRPTQPTPTPPPATPTPPQPTPPAQTTPRDNDPTPDPDDPDDPIVTATRSDSDTSTLSSDPDSDASTATRDPSNPTSSILSDSNSSTRSSSGSGSGRGGSRDPDSPDFVNVPNPSDDPFGLNPSGGGKSTNTPGSHDDADPVSGSKSVNLGAIIGGIVGGLFLLLALIGVLYFFVLRRRRNRTAPSAAYIAQFGDSSGRISSPRPHSPNSRTTTPDLGEPVRPESPTLPRPSSDASSSPGFHLHHWQDNPFTHPDEQAEMRESNVSRTSLNNRQYTRTPTPLIGPRPRGGSR